MTRWSGGLTLQKGGYEIPGCLVSWILDMIMLMVAFMKTFGHLQCGFYAFSLRHVRFNNPLVR